MTKGILLSLILLNLASVSFAARYGERQLLFEPNVGQTPPRADFIARGPGYQLAVDRSGLFLSLKRAGTAREWVQMRLHDTSAESSVRAEELRTAKVNYLLGNNPAAWLTNVETFGKVRYSEVYPGIDLVYYGNEGRLEYDFIVAPGADPSVIRFSFEGAGRVRVGPEGDLRIETAEGFLVLEPPVIYQQTAVGRKLVDGFYSVNVHRTVEFRLGEYDQSQPLIIDPILVYSTYLGGTGDDRPTSIAVDAEGNAYVTGFTESLDFPTQNAAQGAPGGGVEDIVVSKLNADGSELIYSTYIGGTETFRERANKIVVDTSGNAYVVCSTSAPDFPTTSPATGGPFQATASSGDEACVFKLGVDGSTLEFSTYIGGNGNDTGNSIALDGAGNVYVGGFTGSTDLPDTSPNPAGPFQTTRQGSSDGYLAKLTPDGSALVYLTYLGGTGGDAAADIQAGPDGSLYIAGQTSSLDFPVTSANLAGPFQSSPGGAVRDAFAAKLSSDGSALTYATYLGGNGDDVAEALAVDFAGNAYLAGITRSTDFPTAGPGVVGPLQATPGGGEDAFVAKIAADGSELIYSTYLGTAARDVALSLAVDAFGAAFVSGDTGSASFPTQNATQPAYGGGSRDAFASKLSPDGAALLFSTFLGGNDFDSSEGLAVDNAGNVYITGQTRSGNLPLASPDPAGPFQTTRPGTSLTGFVTKIQPFDDNEGPYISGAMANPSVAEVNSPAAGVTVTATADDTNAGGSPITSAEYSVNGGPFAPMQAIDGAFDTPTEGVTAQIGPFATPGVYEICLRATDAAGNVGGADDDCILLPIYDPNGGFVTGGGAVHSPATADLENGISGAARFGFVSKYLPGRSVPEGNLEFRFQDGDLRFQSTSMEWLVVTGEPRAMFRGKGELNGGTLCKFEVDAWDGSFNQGQDAFGLKIFACGAGLHRYSLTPTTLMNGNIKIHQ